MRKIILASASPRRKELMQKLNIPFTDEVADYHEDTTLKFKPRDLIRRFAEGKADTIALRHADAIVIGADTDISFKGKTLGKPYTAARAIRMLSELSGKTHTVFTGYCIIDTKSGKRRSGIVPTKVTFRKLTHREIEAYVATDEPLEAAGAYMIQGGAASFVERIEGDYFNIVGLPLATIVQELAKFDIDA